MERQRRFRPEALDSLESRIVLSHAAASRSVAAIVSHSFPGHQVHSQRQQPVTARIDQAFDSFASDYGQARTTYFASLRQESDPEAAKAAFTSYTTQRASLLSQQLVGSFLQNGSGTAKTKGQPPQVRTLVNREIIGVPGRPPAPGTLAASLVANIPPAGSSDPTITLYSLSQDNAINSARVAVLNVANIVRNQGLGSHGRTHR